MVEVAAWVAVTVGVATEEATWVVETVGEAIEAEAAAEEEAGLWVCSGASPAHPTPGLPTISPYASSANHCKLSVLRTTCVALVCANSNASWYSPCVKWSMTNSEIFGTWNNLWTRSEAKKTLVGEVATW